MTVLQHSKGWGAGAALQSCLYSFDPHSSAGMSTCNLWPQLTLPPPALPHAIMVAALTTRQPVPGCAPITHNNQNVSVPLTLSGLKPEQGEGDAKC